MAIARRATALLRQTRPSGLPHIHTKLRPSFTPPHLSPASFTTSTPRGALAAPLNLPKWLSKNAHLLKPPVGAQRVYKDQMFVMVVGGPNARTDYHINETSEWFYQYKGPLMLKTVQKDEGGAEVFRDIVVSEGSMFLLPPNTPHCPVRFKDTVGIVLELDRPEGSLDRLRWYCQSCGSKVHEVSFVCEDLGAQIKEAVGKLEGETKNRTCGSCGTVCDLRPPPETMEQWEREAWEVQQAP